MTNNSNFKQIQFSLAFVLLTTLVSLFSCSSEDSAKQLKLEKLQVKWNVGSHKWTEADLLTLDKGEQVYVKLCATCHSVNGMGDIGKRSPILIGNPLVNEAADIPIKITLFGKRKMPRYSEKLSNDDIAAILSYVRNAWSNSSGVIITEKEIEDYRHFNLNKLQKKWNWQGKQWQETDLRTLEFGENNYLIHCAGCHAKDGSGQSQIAASVLKANALIMGDPEQQIKIILNGIKTMPAYATLLSDEIIASIISYEKNTWGAKSGTLVYPEQIKKVRLQIEK